MLVADGSEVADQLGLDGRRQHGRPILVALATPDDYLVAPEAGFGGTGGRVSRTARVRAPQALMAYVPGPIDRTRPMPANSFRSGARRL